MTDRRGFTLVELTAVLFVLGLILWTVVPRLSLLGDPGRDAVFRDIASGSEQAFDASLFEKRETCLMLIPYSRTYEFRDPERANDERRPREFSADLAITGIRIEGEERPLDLPTEIRYRPGGLLPEARIHFRDSADKKKPTDWTLLLNPWDGSIKVLEGVVKRDD
ncbi:MAG: prepilin-type N-terminal cleavage/methylation domain-containing protein [Syntrophorhabdaceae bacterium]|nr:prepilin-type N-terminal cleavage/methylation domain-containing protein [Syntrophorhabdaceae bacterium]